MNPTLPLSGDVALALAVVFGAVFGFLLHRGRLTDYNVIVNQFRLRDWTVLKVMFTAIVVGGIGVLALHALGHANYHVKPANMLGIVAGSAIFGLGMVLLGYCPGTGIAALASGSVHALAGVAGMIAGGIAYAMSFAWINEHVLKVWALGKVRLPDVTGVPDWAWFLLLSGIWLAVQRLLSRHSRGSPKSGAPAPTSAVDTRVPVQTPKIAAGHRR